MKVLVALLFVALAAVASAEEGPSGFRGWMSNVASQVDEAVHVAKDKLSGVISSVANSERTKQALTRLSALIKSAEKRLANAKQALAQAANKFQSRAAESAVKVIQRQVERLSQLKAKLESLLNGKADVATVEAEAEAVADAAVEAVSSDAIVQTPAEAVPEEAATETEATEAAAEGPIAA